MVNRVLLVGLGLALLHIVPVMSFGNTQEQAVIALQSKPEFSCGDIGGPECGCFHTRDCSSFAVNWPNPEAFADIYIVVVRADSSAGISEVSFGIEFVNQVSVIEYSCADGLIQTGSTYDWDLTYTWNACQRNSQTEEGMYLHVASITVGAYGDGYCRIRNFQVGGEDALLIKDCAGISSELLTSGGVVGFGANEGFNPCLVDTPVNETTWGKIKGLYEGGP